MKSSISTSFKDEKLALKYIISSWKSECTPLEARATLNINDEIEYVVDINPHRHHKFIPGAGKEVMPPEFLRKYKPDVTVMMNPVYCDEIQELLDDLGVNTEIIPVQ
jgi:hypothetical protein